MKIISDFVTNSSEADYYNECDCDCKYPRNCKTNCDCMSINESTIKNESVDPSLYPIFTKERIYGYMSHKYLYQKDTTYNKAKEYVDTGKIYGLKCNSDCTVFIAKSKGSNSNIYSCRLILVNKRIKEFKCTCPSYTKWHTLCKHLVGMMILIEMTRQKLLTQKNVFDSSRSDSRLSCNNVSTKGDSVASTVAESNFTIYTCSNCGTKYRKYQKRCPLCGNSATANEPISEQERNRMAETKAQILKEKQKTLETNNSVKKDAQCDNSSYGNNNKESTSNENYSGCLIAIVIYIVVSVILGLMGGNIGFGFIASIILFAIIIFIKKIFF